MFKNLIRKLKCERGEIFTDPFGIKSAERKASEAAAAEAEKVRVEQRRIEEKFGALSPEEQERQKRTFELERQQQAKLEERARTQGEDLLKQSGPITTNLLDLIAERQGKTSEQLFIDEGGEAARQLLQTVTGSDLDSIFKGELDLALQEVQKILGRRGITPTGISGDIGLESLGRAGVDAAIKGAQQRLDAKTNLTNTLLNLSSGVRGEAGAVGERALSESGAARNNLQTFFQNLQNLDQASKARTTTAGLQAFGTAQPIISQFGNVPIEIAGFEAGRGAQTQEDVIKGLVGIGKAVATGGASVPEDVLTTAADERSKSRAEEDSLERLLAFSGGGRPNRLTGFIR